MFKTFSIDSIRIILLSLIVFNCGEEEIPDNVLDPDSGDYSEVETLISDGPTEGSIVTASSVTFSFTGGPLVVGYRHRVDFGLEVSEWSDWSTDTVVTYDNLDEGENSFYVMGKYSDTDLQIDPTMRTFTIDAVSGPSVRAFPQVTYAAINSVFQVDIYAEELGVASPVAGIELEILYDAQELSLYGANPITKGSLLSNYSGADFLIDELESGSIKVDIGVTQSNSSSGLTGTGILFSISFETDAPGQSNVEIQSAEYRDANNVSIDIQSIISGIVIVGQ